jgi:hypothetical protein
MKVILVKKQINNMKTKEGIEINFAAQTLINNQLMCAEDGIYHNESGDIQFHIVSGELVAVVPIEVVKEDSEEK